MRLSFLPAMFCAVVAHGFEMSEDFSVSSPDGGAYGIVVERGSNLSHGHGWVEDGAYRIPVDGSRHFLAAPPLGLKGSSMYCEAKTMGPRMHLLDLMAAR